MALYFTRKGADRIQRQLKEFEDKLREVQGTKAHMIDVGGDCWHDNAGFEEAVRQEHMANGRIGETRRKIAQMKVIDGPPPNTEKLRIGHVAHLLVDGEERVALIGGYEDSEAETDPPVMSYLAPLVREFIGKEVGDEEAVAVAGVVKTVVLEKIETPEEHNDNCRRGD